MNLDMRIADGSQFTVPRQCHANSNWFGTKTEELPGHYLIEVPSLFSDVRLIEKEYARLTGETPLRLCLPEVPIMRQITLGALEKQEFDPHHAMASYRDMIAEINILHTLGIQTVRTRKEIREWNRDVKPLLEQRILGTRSRLQEAILQECFGMPVASYLRGVIDLFIKDGGLENMMDPLASWDKLDMTTYLARAIIYENEARTGFRSDSRIDEIRQQYEIIDSITKVAKKKALEKLRTPEASTPAPAFPASGK